MGLKLRFLTLPEALIWPKYRSIPIILIMPLLGQKWPFLSVFRHLLARIASFLCFLLTNRIYQIELVIETEY